MSLYENFANEPQTTLNNGGTLTSSATTLTVTSASSFPTAGNFRIRIDSEYMKVTGVSGDVFTVVRGDGSTSASSHSDGTAVYGIVTKEALESIIVVAANGTDTSARRRLNFIGATVADNSGSNRCDITFSGGGGGGYGTLSSEPSASSPTGEIYLASDAARVDISDGTNWHSFAPIFPITPPPLVATWNTTNISGSVTLTDSNAGPFLYAPAGSGTLRMVMKTAPSTPYTITAAFLCQMSISSSYRTGLIIRDSSGGKLTTFGMAANGGPITLNISQWNSITSFSSNIVNIAIGWNSPWLFFRIHDDGTNRSYWVSVDGREFRPAIHRGVVDLADAQQVGWGIYDAAGVLNFGVTRRPGSSNEG